MGYAYLPGEAVDKIRAIVYTVVMQFARRREEVRA